MKEKREKNSTHCNDLDVYSLRVYVCVSIYCRWLCFFDPELSFCMQFAIFTSQLFLFLVFLLFSATYYLFLLPLQRVILFFRISLPFSAMFVELFPAVCKAFVMNHSLILSNRKYHTITIFNFSFCLKERKYKILCNFFLLWLLYPF